MRGVIAMRVVMVDTVIFVKSQAGILVYIFLISTETGVRNNRNVNSCMKSVEFLKACIHSFSILSDDGSKASSKTIPPHSAI